MTRVEFFFNVPDKLLLVAQLCEQAITKGRRITIFSKDVAMCEQVRRQLWQSSATSFLANAIPAEAESQHTPIIIDSDGQVSLQDDVLINLQQQHPPFFSRFRYLIEMVGIDELDKSEARQRYKFYRDRGYQIQSTDTATTQ